MKILHRRFFFNTSKLAPDRNKILSSGLTDPNDRKLRKYLITSNNHHVFPYMVSNS